MKFTNGDLLGAVNTAFGTATPGLSTAPETQPVFTQATVATLCDVTANHVPTVAVT